jgi:hypothetical protein
MARLLPQQRGPPRLLDLGITSKQPVITPVLLKWGASDMSVNGLPLKSPYSSFRFEPTPQLPDGRQTLPYRITEGLPVSMTQSQPQ